MPPGPEGASTRRTVVVTGAASGIGWATAQAFAAMGEQLVVIDRVEVGDERVEHLRRLAGHDRVAAYQVDVSRTDDVRACLSLSAREVGATDVLVNNAGIGPMKTFVEMSESEWDEVIDVNLKSMFNTCRAVVPTMVQAGLGRIVNVASELGMVGRARMVHYCAAKGGVIAFTKALAREVAAAGITVNVVAPGPVETPLLVDLSDEYTPEGLRNIPLGRWGRPEDVAATIRFVASEEASFYTGWVFSPNGGVVM
ncbi:MAG TPA: SDR family NAD(P)-dependent oxidoreductase [Acidimicrobiales bacterium]|nr:SDR family NAD(P)-dependent oxidoreductase [Acidimicrobiales bacterium]